MKIVVIIIIIALLIISTAPELGPADTIRIPFTKKEISSTAINITAFLIATFLILMLAAMFKVVRVQGFSMEPTFSDGDIVLSRRYETYQGDINVGDIIIYKHDNDYVVHRVYELNSDGTITTKGDAFESIDDYTTNKDDIVGIIYWYD